MYQEVVEIVKSKEDFSINDNGVIRLRIKISMKSGIQHRDLVL